MATKNLDTGELLNLDNIIKVAEQIKTWQPYRPNGNRHDFTPEEMNNAEFCGTIKDISIFIGRTPIGNVSGDMRYSIKIIDAATFRPLRDKIEEATCRSENRPIARKLDELFMLAKSRVTEGKEERAAAMERVRKLLRLSKP